MQSRETHLARPSDTPGSMAFHRATSAIKPSISDIAMYLHVEYQEFNGECMFGSANGGIWWQITILKIGQDHVFGGISFVPKWLVGKTESYLRTTLLSVQQFIFSA